MRRKPTPAPGASDAGRDPGAARGDPRAAGRPSGEELARCLVAVASSADREAFGTLFLHFAPRLKTYFGRLGATAAAAEDLAQETLLRIWKKAGLFDPNKGTAAAWVFAVARNQRLNALRGERHVMVEEEEAYLSIPEDDGPGPEAALAIAEGEARLRHVLSGLSAVDAKLLDLAFFEDKSHSQIGREQGLPLGTVKSRLRRTLLRLRAALGDAP